MHPNKCDYTIPCHPNSQDLKQAIELSYANAYEDTIQSAKIFEPLLFWGHLIPLTGLLRSVQLGNKTQEYINGVPTARISQNQT